MCLDEVIPVIARLTLRPDIALGQWLALTPPQVVKDTLRLSDETIASFKKEKQYVVAGKVDN